MKSEALTLDCRSPAVTGGQADGRTGRSGLRTGEDAPRGRGWDRPLAVFCWVPRRPEPYVVCPTADPPLLDTSLRLRSTRCPRRQKQDEINAGHMTRHRGRANRGVTPRHQAVAVEEDVPRLQRSAGRCRGTRRRKSRGGGP